MLKTTFIFATIILAVALAAHSDQRHDSHSHKHQKQQIGQHKAHSLDNLKTNLHTEHNKHAKAAGRLPDIKHNAKHTGGKAKTKGKSHKHKHNRSPLYGKDKEQHKHHQNEKKHHQQQHHTGARRHF